MSSEEKFAKVEVCSGGFGECLVGGSAEERSQRRKVKRRAIAISVGLESLLLGALVIAPMLAKPAEIKMTGIIPIPPYSHSRQRHSDTPARHDVPRPHGPFWATPVPTNAVTVDRTAPAEPSDPGIPIGDAAPTTGPALIDALDRRVPPPPPGTNDSPKKRLVVSHLDPALLTHRVEPVFPALARQIRRSGKVELHAIIGTDGSIQSLAVVSGDPLFIQSALDAVRQWRYTPTKLGGQTVEIDTFITVIYSLDQH